MAPKISDKINLLSKFTPLRLANALSITGSYYFSRLTGKAWHAGMPVSLSVEPTTACNLRCPQCPSGLRSFSRNTGMLSEDFFRIVIDQVQHKLLYLTFYFQGEPFLHPRFLEMVKYASQKRIYTSTSTNAHFLSEDTARRTVESGLDRIIVSMDGLTQEVYEKYRKGGDLNKVRSGIASLVKWKRELGRKKPHIILQFIAFRFNEHQAAEMRAFGKSAGADEVRIKTAQVYDYETADEYIPEESGRSRYEKRNGSANYEIRNRLLNHCWRMWHSCVVTWDGKVVPCCFDKDAAHRMGDLRQASFAAVWTGKAYSRFRSGLLRSRRDIDICRNCTEGTKVWAD